MSFKFIIDNREIYIKKYFNNNTDKFPNIIYKNLDLGDIIVEFNDIPLIIIERKTIPDLLASIKDGRYREQKTRIKDSGIKYKIYLIEDDITSQNILSSAQNKMITSSLLSIIIQEINILKTSSLADTINILKTLYKKLICSKGNTILNYILQNNLSGDNLSGDNLSGDNLSGDNLSGDNLSVSKYVNNVNDCINIKKKSLDPLQCFKNQLCQIPGISNTISNVIITNYKNMNELLNAFNKMDCKDELKYKLLENMSWENNDKTRRIGPRKAEQVYNYLFI
jgi:crossover junction endonuclease MUS81